MSRLGYTRYVAQGGDVGAGVTDAMAIQAPGGLAGIHLNFLRRPPLAVPAALLGRAPVPQRFTDDEQAALAAFGRRPGRVMPPSRARRHKPSAIP